MNRKGNMRTLDGPRVFRPWTSVGLLVQAALAQGRPVDQAPLSGLGDVGSAALDPSYFLDPPQQPNVRIFDPARRYDL